MGHSEVGVDFVFYYYFLQIQSIEFTNAFARSDIPIGGQSSLNFPGISRVMEDKVVLFSD